MQLQPISADLTLVKRGLFFVQFLYTAVMLAGQAPAVQHVRAGAALEDMFCNMLLHQSQVLKQSITFECKKKKKEITL